MKKLIIAIILIVALIAVPVSAASNVDTLYTKVSSLKSIVISHGAKPDSTTVQSLVSIQNSIKLYKQFPYRWYIQPLADVHTYRAVLTEATLPGIKKDIRDKRLQFEDARRAEQIVKWIDRV